ncbi:SAM-dependent methyltransferase [Sinorhizobium kostiense]|uniref:SAM-dependent methyltransferase n=1 Tax=Sinorhizobium kostiense TaxID=76747 RepID=A0ABS4QTC3_9HYPH|nr:class I SAM-dependent methyltransferase [Sinorhizobium kostiense]MBP2233904.1 SAM-dependent methyltransferase [Sinorhizobium kostiense]
MMQNQSDDRLARERDFHNDRFGAVEARKEDTFYFAAEAAVVAYWKLVRQTTAGKDVLEYGCSNGQSSMRLAPSAKHISGIDISDVAIAQAKAEAARRSISNVSFSVGNAEKMDFPPASFDVVFGSGILHHLNLEEALTEIRRVLRPSGRAIFFEPLGHNPAINLYRRRTPEARTVDEHPLLKSDFSIVGQHFSRYDLQFFGLSTLASLPFRTLAAGRAIRAVGERVDNLLLKIPGLKWQAWIVVMVLEA